MPIPTRVFTADEAQAILDYIDRLGAGVSVVLPVSEEESAALAKLRELGQFYLPDNLKED